MLCMGTNLLASYEKTVLNYTNSDLQVILNSSVQGSSLGSDAFTVPQATSTTTPGQMKTSEVFNVTSIDVIKGGTIVNCTTGQSCTTMVKGGTKIGSKNISSNPYISITISIMPASDGTITIK